MEHPVCLICEDELLISMDVKACLEGIGVAVAGPFASGDDALEWAATNTADVAVLDYRLQDGECLPLVSALQKKLPIVIHSGWLPNEANTSPKVSRLPWVSKPMDCNTLLKAIAAAAPQIIVQDKRDY